MGPPVNILKSPSEYALWLSNLALVAKQPNVSVKLSCLMPVIGSTFHLHRISPYIQAGAGADEIAASGFGNMIRETIKLFGVERCLWASNYPSDKTSARFGELAAATWIILKEMGVSKAGRVAVMRDNAVRVYRLELPKEPIKGDGVGVRQMVSRL
jgi:L-fuconolactonase